MPTDTLSSTDAELAKLRKRVENDRAAAVTAALDLSKRAASDPEADAELEFAFSRIDQLSQRLGAIPEVRVTREPDIYQRGDRRVGFFRDLVAAADPPFPVPGVSSGHEARERLRRHSEYERVRLEVQADLSQRALGLYGIERRARPTTGEFSQRALSSVSGAGGEFVPPKWMTELWASVARAACPLRDLSTRVDLPPDTLELHVPRFDSVAGVVPEQTENTQPSDVYSATDAVVAPVRTFLGDAMLSLQEFQRSVLASDEIILRDFADNYGAALQSQLINGTGTNGQLLGLLNVSPSTVNSVPGARLVTYTDASPTATKIVQAVAQCAAQISDTRERPPSVILCRGARWFYLSGSPDGSTNVSEQRVGTGVIPTDSDTGPFGPIASLPVYHDNTIPANLGTGTNQDAIVLVRAKDIILLEEAAPRFTSFTAGGNANQLEVVLQWHTYTAAFTSLYPSGIGTVQGTGLVVPAGY